MKFKAVAAVSSVVLAALAVLAAGPRQGHAASAIMVDRLTGAYGFCAGASDPYAAMTCAQERCEVAGGQNCQVVEGCPQGGHGAVARDVAARLVGGSCGLASEAQARAQAMQRCVGLGAANCEISEVFVEAGPGSAQSAAIPQASPPAQPMAPAAGGASGTATQPAPRPQAAQPRAPAPQPSQPVQQQPVAPQPEAPPQAATAPSAGAPSEQPAREEAERKEAVEGVVDSLKQRTETTTQQQAYAPLTDEQQAVADKLIGVWSSRDCAEKFWRITKEGDQRYNVFVWYEDGQEDRTEFEVSFEEELMVLTWDTRLPNTIEGMKRGRRYVEKVGNIADDAYVVVENNYKDFKRPWTVHRCTEKR